MELTVFYAYVRNGAAVGLLAGPFDTREQADDMVEPARLEAMMICPLAHFYEFGTAVVRSLNGVLPSGKLNARLSLPTAPIGRPSADLILESMRAADA